MSRPPSRRTGGDGVSGAATVDVEAGCGVRRLALELRRVRRAHGMSQREAVRRLGLSAHSNLVDYELGRRIPPADIISACEALFALPSGHLERLRDAALVERADRTPVGPPPVSPARHPVPLLPGRAAGRAPAPVRQPPGVARPMQLPAGVVGFTGRTRYLGQLDTLLSGPDGRPDGTAAGPVRIGAVTGTAGVGKTALALHWAHRVRGRFPDGQLYVDLHGCAATPPVRAADAVARCLRALGVPAADVPTDPEDAASLYRSLLADRRLLVMLDDASSPEQVRPLLPGIAGCLLLVTSRDRLDGLVARDGTERVTLDPLTVVESVTLLARILGAERVTAELTAAVELARVCARLPLALRIAAARLAGQPGRGIGCFVAELSTGDRLAALQVADDGPTALRAAFDLSYRTLPVEAQRLFRRLGLTPGPEVTPESAAALADTTVEQAGRTLDRLARAHLLAPHRPGRYLLHELLRLYAADRARDTDPAADRAAATARLHRWRLDQRALPPVPVGR